MQADNRERSIQNVVHHCQVRRSLPHCELAAMYQHCFSSTAIKSARPQFRHTQVCVPEFSLTCDSPRSEYMLHFASVANDVELHEIIPLSADL
jgi:hypothetical protein